MKLAKFFDDDRAVSPVIGVILMVAITVILAAVIGTFVLGLGDQVQQTTPRASFGFSQTTEKVGGIDYTTVTVTHESGDTIEANNLEVTVDGKTAYTRVSSSDNTTQGTFSGKVSAGSSVTILGATNNDSVETGTSIFHDDSGTLIIDIDGVNASTSGDNVSPVGLSSGETIRVVYSSPDSDKSATLAKKEVS